MRLIEQEPELTEQMAFLADNNFPGMTADRLRQTAQQMAIKRIVVAVRPDKVMSWDHRKLAGKAPD